MIATEYCRCKLDIRAYHTDNMIPLELFVHIKQKQKNQIVTIVKNMMCARFFTLSNLKSQFFVYKKVRQRKAIILRLFYAVFSQYSPFLFSSYLFIKIGWKKYEKSSKIPLNIFEQKILINPSLIQLFRKQNHLKSKSAFSNQVYLAQMIKCKPQLGDIMLNIIYSLMQVRKATLLLIICSLITSITSLICSNIYSRTPFSFQGFKTPSNTYLLQKYSSTKYQLQWIIFIQESIVILFLVAITTNLAFKINNTKSSSMVGIYMMLSQTIMSQIAVVGHSIAIIRQIGYFEGNFYSDIAMAALRSLTFLLVVIVLITNLYNFMSQPQQCIKLARQNSKSVSNQPDGKENMKKNIQVEIEQQQIEAFHKNRPAIVASSSPMSAFFDGIGQSVEKTVEVQLAKPEDARMTHQNQNEEIQNDFTVQPIRSKRKQRTIKIPKLDLNKVKNSLNSPQIFFPSFAGIDISAIHQSNQPNNKDQYDSSQSDSEALQIEQALRNNNNISQPFL